MNRLAMLAFALALLATPATAQEGVPETIEVIGAHSLAGIWKIHFPYGISLSIPGVISGTQGGHEAFCRMEEGKEALSVSCLPWNGNGTASLENGRLHLAFCCAAVFRYVIDAPVVSATAFMGVYKLKVFGDSHEARMPASGRKLAPSAGTPDAAEQSAALRTALEAIVSGVTPPPDELTRKRFSPFFGGPPAMSSASLRGLGSLVQVIYLGVNSPPEAPPGLPPPKRENPPLQRGKQLEIYKGYGVYDVEFANGERLCGLHTDESGKVNVLCV